MVWLKILFRWESLGTGNLLLAGASSISRGKGLFGRRQVWVPYLPQMACSYYSLSSWVWIQALWQRETRLLMSSIRKAPSVTGLQLLI
jgi:hypothetical protein